MNVQKAESKVKLISKMRACTSDIEKKYVGMLPHKSANVVKPNESPGLCLRMEAMVQSVIGIVILKSTIPAIESNAVFSPKYRRGVDSVRAKTPIVLAPNLSPKNPPATLPKQAQIPGKNMFVPVFHAIGIMKPT